MSNFLVVGIVRGSYKKGNEERPYTRLYCTYELDNCKYSSADVSGIGCDIIYIGKIIDEVCVNDLITPVYNKYGTCVDILIH